jgi:thiamine-monophosphate kinase
MDGKTIAEIGEKALIRDYLLPLLNASGESRLPGDDCAVLSALSGTDVCFSTDRVPHDLISFELGLIGYKELGNYLVVLNISDIAAMGARPVGLLLNLALPADLSFEYFRDLILGARDACNRYGCAIIGGDLSSSPTLSISATSIGICPSGKAITRRGARPGDKVFCTEKVGLTSTAFLYHLKAKHTGLSLSEEQETFLARNFKDPKAYVAAGAALASEPQPRTCMDNTDGIGQTLTELAEANACAIVLREDCLPCLEVSSIVARHLGMQTTDVALGPGADFQLIGTCSASTGIPDSLRAHGFHEIGQVHSGKGVYIKTISGETHPPNIAGWNYFAKASADLFSPQRGSA